tara:strand:- start:5067 stop:5276 length:210 start_codon:yes stop_codon:yes gene_type:complete
MKIKLSRLQEIVSTIVKEAAAQGKMQKIYRNSYKRMIGLAATGGTKNSAPFTKKAKGPSRSGIAEDHKK